MSEPSKSSVLPWSIAGTFLLVCMVLLLNPRKETIVREVEKPVPVEVYRTNEVVKEVEKRVEVPRIVEVPAPIPEFYATASNFFVGYFQAVYSSNTPSPLKGLTNVAAVVVLDKHLADYASEDELKTRFELTLRKNGIGLSEGSLYTLNIVVDGLPIENANGESLHMFSYDVNIVLLEPTVLYRAGGPQRLTVRTWADGKFGYAGTQVVKGALLDAVQSEAEKFANEYLEQNPSK